MNLDYIDKLLDVDKYYLYYKNKPILSESSFKKLEKEIKESIDAPTKDIPVFVVHFVKNSNKNKLFVVNCTAFTITKTLHLVTGNDDYGQSITFSQEQLERKKFKLSDIITIMKAIKERKVSFAKLSVPFDDIIN